MNWNNRTSIRFICQGINVHSCLLPIPMPLTLRKLRDLTIFTMQPESCRRQQQKAGDLYGAQKTYYLVNGSTCGLLAAISAAVPRGGKILVARNCHKAVYHAMYLRQLVPVYLYPEDTAYGHPGAGNTTDGAKAAKTDTGISGPLSLLPRHTTGSYRISKALRIPCMHMGFR